MNRADIIEFLAASIAKTALTAADIATTMSQNPGSQQFINKTPQVPLAGRLSTRAVIYHLISMHGNGSDFIAAHPGPDLVPALAVTRACTRVLLGFEQPGAQDAQGRLLIMVLGALALAPDMDAGRHVRHLNRALGPVPVLPAGP